MPKVKPDELVDALSYTKVLVAWAAILAPMIEKAVTTAIDKCLATAVGAIIDSKLGSLLGTVRELKDSCTSLQSKTDRIEHESVSLREQLALQTRGVDDMETSRGENFVLKGIPEVL